MALGAGWGHALRFFRHSPSFAAVASVTLAVAIGLATAVCSLVYSVLLRPLPYAGADRIVRLSETLPDGPLPAGRFVVVINDDHEESSTLKDVTIGVWSRSTRTLEAITPFTTSGRNVVTSRGTERILTAEVGSRFFGLLGTQPVQGRMFVDGDGTPGAMRVAVVSERFWISWLDSRSDAIGSLLRVDDESYLVVGIAPSGVPFPQPGIDVWTAGQWRWPTAGGRRMFSIALGVIARLRPGATAAGATLEGQQVVRQIAVTDPAFADGNVPIPTARVVSLRDDLVAPVRSALVALLAGVVLVLAAAGVSLAGLLVARNAARQNEVAIRIALGATERRIIASVVLEQALIAGAGASGGAALGWWMLRLLPHVAPADLPRLEDLQFSLPSFAFACVVPILTALVISVASMWRISSRDLRELANAGRIRLAGRAISPEATRRLLVVGQVALASMLLVGALLAGRSLWAVVQVDPGYRSEQVLTLQVALPQQARRERGRQRQFCHSLIERLAAHPDVSAVGWASMLPLHGFGSYGTLRIEGRPWEAAPDERPTAFHQAVTGDYFRALGTSLQRGRLFNAGDTAGSQPVAIIDEVIAQRYFPNQDPLGRRVIFPARTPREIVGIVSAVRFRAITAAAEPILYVPSTQLADGLAHGGPSGGLAVRTRGNPGDLLPFVRSAVRELEAGSPVFNAMPLEDRISSTFAEPRFYAIALTLFAALALATAVLAVYGVLAYSVERRRAEFGVRRALGAEGRHIVLLVLRQGLGLSTLGLVLGLTAAAFGGRIMRSVLYGVAPLDPAAFGAAALLVLIVSATAAWRPARRTLRIDPVQVLKAQ